MALVLAGCDRQPEPDPTPTPTASSSDGPRSIFQPEYQEEAPESQIPVTPEPLRETIGFPEGGSDLDDAARTALRTVLDSPQMAENWPIILRGHSDAGGSGDANLNASTARAEAVRDAMVDEGIAADRITVIAFGEQNPVEPNALPNGEPNEKGRAANRRVDITIDSPDDIATSPGREPTIVETIAAPTPGPSPLTSPSPRQNRR